MARRLRTGGLFVGWAIAGAGTVLGLISLGPLALLPAVALIVILATRDGTGHAAWGLAGLVLVAVSVAGTITAHRR
jgi:hypothetical protein